MNIHIVRDRFAVAAAVSGLLIASIGVVNGSPPLEGDTSCVLDVGPTCGPSEPIPCSADFTCCHYTLYNEAGCEVLTRFTCCPLPYSNGGFGCWANWRMDEDQYVLYVWCGDPEDDPYNQRGINDPGIVGP